MDQAKELLIRGTKELGFKISDLQIEQFFKYYEMLIETNRSMNLTSIVEKDDVVIKHFLDSLLVAKSFDLSKVNTMIDVGTGAGFPGIPIKIMYPDIQIVLLDSLNKRLNFLNDVISQLGLEGIVTVHGRAEDAAHLKEYREQFDLCVSRAVANLSTLCEYCIPFIRVGGNFISYKSATSNEEIFSAQNAIKILGGEITDTSTVLLPCSEMERTFVNIQKKKQTPKNYPRKAGTPAKNPIK